MTACGAATARCQRVEDSTAPHRFANGHRDARCSACNDDNDVHRQDRSTSPFAGREERPDATLRRPTTSGLLRPQPNAVSLLGLCVGSWPSPVRIVVHHIKYARLVP